MKLTKYFRVPGFTLVLLCFFCCPEIFSNTLPKCDALIVQGVREMNKKNHTHSLELLMQARMLAAKNHWYKQEFLALNNIGANYYMLLEYGEALNYYFKAYTLALQHLESSSEMVVLNNIAILHSKDHQYAKADEYFTMAYEIAKKNNDTLKMGLYALNRGNVTSQSGNPELARTFFADALLHLVDQPQYAILAKIGLADCDLAQGNPFKARTIAMQLLKDSKDLNFNDSGISILTIISKAYLLENNADQAAVYANQILLRKPDLEEQSAVYELLSEINFKKQNYQQAIAFKDSVLNVTIRMNEIKNGKLYESSKVKFEIENYRRELMASKEARSDERRLFYSIIAIIIVIVILVVFSLRAMALNHKQKKSIAERNEQVMALELENEKSQSLLLEKQLGENQAISQLEQERLKNEVEARNRKLSAKALYLSGRNQMIEDVLSQLSQLPQVASDKSLPSQLQTLKNHLKTDSEWDNFIVHFEEVNQSFLMKLKSTHPTLTANDIRFISYLYMNLSTKEIASMLNITTDSCRKRKERIAAKMNLAPGVSLYDYLTSL